MLYSCLVSMESRASGRVIGGSNRKGDLCVELAVYFLRKEERLAGATRLYPEGIARELI